MLKCRICQAHWDALFLRRFMSERTSCAMTARVLGLDGESAGGNGRAVTLGLPGSVLCGCVWFGVC